MKPRKKLMRAVFIVLVAALTGWGWAVPGAAARAAADVTSPEEFFGFQLGADKKIARPWFRWPWSTSPSRRWWWPWFE